MLKKLLFYVIALLPLCKSYCLNNSNNFTVNDVVTVTVNFNGTATVINNLYTGSLWEVQYGPEGFLNAGLTGTTANSQNFNSTQININPYISYDFRVRDRSFGGGNAWSAIQTVAYTPVSYTANYSTDFSSSSSGWQYYLNYPNYNTYTGAYVGNNGVGEESGDAMIINSISYTPTLILTTPLFSDLSNDKKVAFRLYGHNNSILKLGTLSNPYDVNTFHELQTIPVRSLNNWSEVTVYFNNYNGTDAYLAFSYAGSDTTIIDNFSYEQGVYCAAVSDVTITAVSENTAQLNFTPNSVETQWEVELYNETTYETQNYIINDSNYTLQNLTGDSNYLFKMRAACTATQFSNWSDVIPFTTTCNNVTAGYTTSFGSSDYILACWDVYSTIPNCVYPIYNSATAINITMPKTGAAMMYMNNVNSLENELFLISPYVEDLDANKSISFYSIAGSYSGHYPLSTLIVGTMASPDDYTSFTPIGTVNPGDMRDNLDYNWFERWKKNIVYFDNYNNDHHYIAIKHGQQDVQNYFFIDDFSYENKPACTEPQYPVMLTTQNNQVTVSWQNYTGSSAAQWQIEYGPSGFVHGSGTTITASQIPFTISNIPLDNTSYDFYVRSVCGNDYSNWSDIGRFKTKCNAVDVGYTQGFENDDVTEINNCWTRLTPITNDPYYSPGHFIRTVEESMSFSDFNAHTGTKGIMIGNGTNSLYPDAAEKTILVSPQLSDFDNYKTVSFWLNTLGFSRNHSPTQIQVGTLSNPDDYTTFTLQYTITDGTQYDNAWRQYTIDFSGYTGTDKYVGIRHVQSNREAILLDDFEYGEIECPAPTNVTARQTDTTSVTIAWNNNVQSTPDSWELMYNDTLITATTNPYVLTDLNPFETYTVKVRNLCSEGVYSNWSSIANVKPTCSYTAPFYENFDQYTANSATPHDFCWSFNTFATYVTEFCSDGLNSCPNGVAINTSTDYQTGQRVAGLLTSPFLADFDNTKKVRFFAYNLSQDSNIIVGTIDNPLYPDTFVPYATVELNHDYVRGREYEVDFSGYTGSSKHIAFKNDGLLDLSYITIDDIRYDNIGACPEPLNANTYNVTDTTCLIKWDNTVNTAQDFSIEYGLNGFTPGAGTTVTATGTEKLLENLDVNSTYQFYISTNCSDESGITIGPKYFTTTCNEMPLPWLENFASMNQYGNNLLPDCFRLINGNITTYNTETTTYYNHFESNHILSGVDDTSYAYLSGYYTRLITPVFELTAGTTYTFSLDARKGYEYSSFNIKTSVNRGNTIQSLDTKLAAVGTIHEDTYSPILYYFTPLVSGTYSYQLNFETPGATDAIIDNMRLQEGYTNVMEDTSNILNLENGIPEEIIPEETSNTNISLQNTSNNSVIVMSGGIDESSWNNITAGRAMAPLTQNNNDLWLANENFITKLNMKMNVPVQDLMLGIDMRQTFGTTSDNSQFRVMVNGLAVGEIEHPETANADTSIQRIYDLTAYTGVPMHISLQHLGKNSGDNAYIDNVVFGENLFVKNSIFKNIKVYPNPAYNIVTIQNTEPITGIEITNINGQQLYKDHYNAKHVKLDLSGYKSGVYFIKVYVGEKQKTFKVIKN